MTNSAITLYDITQGPWAPNTSASVNPVPSDQYLPMITSDGLQVMSQNTKEMAGGLVSTDVPFTAGSLYFGLDVEWTETAEDFPHKSRNEFDLKITTVSGSAKPLPNQANGSCQWNRDAGCWQLDPSGKGWVSTPFTQAPVVGKNTFQSRWWTDGKLWSCIGLRVNGAIWTATPAFQVFEMITTGWAAGLHPQLQMECSGVNWFLIGRYQKVRVLSSVSQIGF